MRYIMLFILLGGFAILINAETQSNPELPKLEIVQELRAIKSDNEASLTSQKEALEKLEKIGEDAREARIFAARSNRG